MRHVDHEVGADLFRHLGEAFEVDAQRVGGGAGDDQLRLLLARQPFHLVVVDLFLVVQAVGNHVEPFAGHVERHAVGQVAAFGQRHAHDGVARFQHRKEHALVRLRAGVRLHVGGFGAEQLLEAVDRQLLDDVDVFAAAVVALAGIAFCILIGQLRALRFHHGRRGVVLGRDQLDVFLLADGFLLDRGRHFRIDIGEGKVFSEHALLRLKI